MGLITNSTGVDRGGRRTIDLLYHARGVKLLALFSPEHGLTARRTGRSSPVRTRTRGCRCTTFMCGPPTDRMLGRLDALIYDIQDAGVRFYTYITTMGYCIGGGSQERNRVLRMDRPNPINGYDVQGPVLDGDMASFVAYYALPIRHGMTVGELAEMFNSEKHIGVRLHVIKMKDWQRTDWYDETGLAW